MKLENKIRIAEDLRGRFAKSKVIIVTDYKGLNVTTINALRRKLQEVEVEFKVVKNTLLIRAAEDTNVALIKEHFKGPSAIAISYTDPVAPAKVLAEFAGEFKKLEIKVGVMGDKVLDLSAIKALSQLPSREVLLGQVLSAMNGVPTAFVRALNDNIGRLLNVLTAIKDQKEAA
ncbi:MAG: 50S ribosomal protein L10 [Deltaproteobacteria bacterium]|nr:50S ribosomal protein L10 [Deltaproteobacteria bacterium]